jgi:hypothetical protein
LKGQTKRFPAIYWTWLLEVGVARSVTDGRLALTGVHVLNWILDILGDLRVVVVVVAGMMKLMDGPEGLLEAVAEVTVTGTAAVLRGHATMM